MIEAFEKSVFEGLSVYIFMCGYQLKVFGIRKVVSSVQSELSCTSFPPPDLRDWTYYLFELSHIYSFQGHAFSCQTRCILGSPNPQGDFLLSTHPRIHISGYSCAKTPHFSLIWSSILCHRRAASKVVTEIADAQFCEYTSF